MYLVFTHMPGESYCRWFRSLWQCSCNVFWVPMNSFWLHTGPHSIPGHLQYWLVYIIISVTCDSNHFHISCSKRNSKASDYSNRKQRHVISLKHLQVQQLYTLITIQSSSSTPQTSSIPKTMPLSVAHAHPYDVKKEESSLTLEFSGCTFLVLISGSDVTIRLHHSIWFTWDTSWTPILHQLFHPTWKNILPLIIND